MTKIIILSVIILLCLVLSGYFSCLDMAYSGANKLYLERESKKNRKERNQHLEISIHGMLKSKHIPEIYGEVKISEGVNEFGDHEYTTTGEQRTGCSMCGFGIQMEQRPHRFDRLYERNPKEWDFWMNRCCKDDNGIEYGWGRVLDYIGIPWKDPDHWWLNAEIEGQMNIFDYMTDDGFLIEME